MLHKVIFISACLISTSTGNDVVLGILGNTAFIECQLPISGTLIWQTKDGNVIAVNGKLINENSTKYMIEKQNELRESLLIRDLTLADDNVFRCFDLKNASLVHATKLNVLARPRLMAATISPQQPMIEGTEVTLRCEADGGKPLPDIKWFIQFANGSVTEVTGNVTDIRYLNGTGHRINTLRTNVTEHLYQTTFICNVSVSLLYQETFTIHADVLLAPLKPALTARDYDGSFDDNSLLEADCLSAGSRPTASIYWLLDGNKLGDVEVVVKPQENGTFVIKSHINKLLSRGYDGSVLTCAVTNKVLLDRGLPPRTASITLLASYKPRVTVEQEEYAAERGSNVTFRCRIDANPLPLADQLYWTHRGAMIDRKYYALSNESNVLTLVLDTVEISDAGNYTCHASNRIGSAASAPTHLAVLYAPVCTFGTIQTHAVRRGDKARLNCRMQASPTDVIFTWIYRETGERIKSTQAVVDMRNKEHVYAELTIRAQLRYTEIECYGNNTQGLSPKPCIYKIVPPGPPDPPTNCSTSVDGTRVQLICDSGFDGGSVQHFILQKIGMREFETMLSGTLPSFTFDTVQNMTIRICALNVDYRNVRKCAVSTSVIVYITDQTRSDPIKAENSQTTAYIAGGIIAGIGIVVIAIIVSLLLFRKYKEMPTRRSNVSLDMSSTRQRVKSNKLDKMWKSLVSFTTVTKASPDQPATPAIRRCEVVVDIDNNDVPYQDSVALASTPAHHLTTCRVKRTANGTAFLPKIENSIKIEKETAPDVIYESTGFALSPIVAPNNNSVCSFLARNPVKHLDTVIENHRLDDRSTENTYTGYSTCYNIDGMIDVLCESDTCDLPKDAEMETVEASYAQTLDKEYTAGDIADILDTTEQSVLDCETNLKNHNASNGKESDTTVQGSNNTIASINQTQNFEESDTIPQFMNVDFSTESIDANNVSKMNIVSEESFWVNVDILDETLLLRSPLRKSYTCNDNIATDAGIGKSNSLPYMTRKQRKRNLNNVYRVSDLNHQCATGNTNKTDDKEFQRLSHSTKLFDCSGEKFNTATACCTTVVDMDNPASSNTSVVANISEAICDIDENILTVTSDEENENNNHISGIVDGTSELIRMSTPASSTPAAQVGSISDIDQFTLINTSDCSTDYGNIVEDKQKNTANNVTGTDVIPRDNSFDPQRDGDSTNSRSRRDILRRDSFIEAINNTIDESDVINQLTKKKESCVSLDFETEGSYFNYVYENDSDSRYNNDNSRKLSSSKEDDKINEESKQNVNVMAYF